VAVLHLAFDLDSEVYPELYAKLAALSNPDARGERLRQLAASGLVWEAVRMQGPAVTGKPAKPLAKPAAAPARPAPKPPAPPRHDFVDLAIDAVPPPDRVSARELQAAAQRLPVLVDVVDSSPPIHLDAVPLHIGSQPAPRSRLMRMKERGLFKNEG
jgi:hypothetical protein